MRPVCNTKEPCVSTKEPRVSTPNEPCVLTKEPYVSAKKLCLDDMEPVFNTCSA